MRLPALILGITMFCSFARAQENCSLMVRTVDTQGREIPAHVTVEEQNGRRHVSNLLDKHGAMVRFCDLGILPVNVSAGISCGDQVSATVRLEWGETKVINLMLANTPCADTFIYPCQILYRFVDAENRPLEGVSLKTQIPDEKTYTSDEFGRLYVKLQSSRELRGVASAEDFTSITVEDDCTEERLIERNLVLSK